MNRLRASYVVNAGDDVMIRARDVEELDGKVFRIDGDGNLNLPLIGKFRAAGSTVSALEKTLAGSLSGYIRNPQVMLTVTGVRSDQVFLVGAFQKPGVYPLQGRQTLFELLALSGGLQTGANRRIRITRRLEYGTIPLPNARQAAGLSIATIILGSLRQNIGPEEDIVLKPYDTITADKAELVYVTGEVSKAGGFDLGDRESVTISQLITMMGGLTRAADAKRVKVLRPVMDSGRRADISVNLESILNGRTPDFQLYPNDMLYVPRDSKKTAWRTAGLLALPVIPTLLFLVAR